jgi:drug/metabolite transporter (DMT)-like permease
MAAAKTDAGKGVLAIVALAATVALLSVLARYLSSDFTIFQQVYLRLFVAFVLAALVFYKFVRWRVIAKISRREWAVLAFRGLAGYAIGVTLMSKAATLTTIGNVTFIAALPFVPMLGFILLKEKVTWWKLVFLGSALAGAFLLSVRSFSDVFAFNPGDGLAAVAAVGMALSYIGRRWQSGVLNNQEITVLMILFGFGFVLLASLFAGQGAPPLAISSHMVWLALVAAGALSAVKLFLANYGFQRVEMVRAGNLLTVEGVWGVLFGLLFYREVPTWHGLLGGAVIIASVIGMNMYSRHAHVKAATSLDGAHVTGLNGGR